MRSAASISSNNGPAKHDDSSTIAKKLRSLIRTSNDEYVLEVIRDNVGAGVGNTPYRALFNYLKTDTLMRVGTSAPFDNKLIARIKFNAEPSLLAVGTRVAWVYLPSSRQLYPISFTGCESRIGPDGKDVSGTACWRVPR